MFVMLSVNKRCAPVNSWAADYCLEVGMFRRATHYISDTPFLFQAQPETSLPSREIVIIHTKLNYLNIPRQVQWAECMRPKRGNGRGLGQLADSLNHKTTGSGSGAGSCSAAAASAHTVHMRPCSYLLALESSWSHCRTFAISLHLIPSN